ncbi:MAG: hypothetical protein BAA02_10120 [Paenibacillaceae bacterium ZCTH02-B3]|nr:MAG: hypothetical protein BAA02_10120 [Paenibacillaceae bacterium ZCTH02-B3]
MPADDTKQLLLLRFRHPFVQPRRRHRQQPPVDFRRFHPGTFQIVLHILILDLFPIHAGQHFNKARGPRGHGADGEQNDLIGYSKGFLQWNLY